MSSKINIRFAMLHTPLSQTFYDEYMSLLSSIEATKVERFHRKQDQDASILGKVLLAQGLVSLRHNKSLIKKLAYTEHKRPHIEGLALDFNITHSHPCVATAISTACRVGIDVEAMRPIEEFAFEQFFCAEELDWMGDDIERFYTLWTRKESVIKAAGKGVYHDLPAINILGDSCEVDGVTYFVTPLDLGDGLKAALATTDNSIEVNVVEFEILG
jgi:4'-phosphopantetheinyl transferase